MAKYRNVRTGRILERPAVDEWLEASSGWERLDADGWTWDEDGAPEPSGNEEHEGSKD